MASCHSGVSPQVTEAPLKATGSRDSGSHQASHGPLEGFAFAGVHPGWCFAAVGAGGMLVPRLLQPFHFQMKVWSWAERQPPCHSRSMAVAAIAAALVAAPVAAVRSHLPIGADWSSGEVRKGGTLAGSSHLVLGVGISEDCSSEYEDASRPAGRPSWQTAAAAAADRGMRVEKLHSASAYGLGSRMRPRTISAGLGHQAG